MAVTSTWLRDDPPVQSEPLMATPAIPLAEFDKEMATTRRLLERVPDEKGSWKPHDKSFPLAHLAQLVAGMPGWFPLILDQSELDVATGPGYSIEKTGALLERFDTDVEKARKALGRVTGDALDAPWSLKLGDRVLSTQPKGEVARETLRHLIHHRGQLTVYLRLLDVPLPSIYGPTADEGWGG
jgi:uncharacterized damage-inducible protein DinB